METKTVLMPRELTAENGAKALMIGEYWESIEMTCLDCHIDGCETCEGSGVITIKVAVSWTNIKEIYAKAVEHFGV